MKIVSLLIMLFGLLFVRVDVAQATSNEDYAVIIANKLENKVSTKTDSQKKSFFQLIIDSLEPHQAKHPVIPMVQDLMQERIVELSEEEVTVDLPYDYTIPNVDMQRVRDAWFGRVNDFRAAKGLEAYTHSRQLEATAKDWSNTLAVRFAGLGRSRPEGGTHWRNSASEGYYNSDIINAWFADRGVTRRVGESVGYRGFSCNKTDCTDIMISSLKKIFDMYMAEGGNGPHYKMLAANYYGQMGFGLTIEDNYKVWAVFHIAENE